MIRRPIPTFSIDDAMVSICAFAPAVEKSPHLQLRLSHARAWYAVKDASGHWAFAPGKWAGYQRMTPNQYLDPNDGIDGRQTEKRLNQWFTFLDPEKFSHTDLRRCLNEFLGKYGKQSSSACRIAITRGQEDTKTTNDDDIVELIVRIVDRLDGGQRNKILRALKADKALAASAS